MGFSSLVSTPLCEIMGRNKSDKGDVNILSSWHNYTTYYYFIFQELKEKPLRVFELGIGSNNVNIPSNMGANGRPGASLYGWAEFFPNAKVFGADIDKNILFETDQIKTFYCDQTKPESIRALWNEPALQEDFDILIEDGLHTFQANCCFLENSIHKLKSRGYFIIEDIMNAEYHLFQNKLGEWKARYPGYTFELLQIPSMVNTYDNNLLVIQKQ